MSQVTSISSIPVKEARQCNGCTKCCEGYLDTEVLGEKLYPGHGCQHLGKTGCTIHDSRPTDPCRNYKCYWLGDPVLVPEEFWPARSNVIMTRRWLDSGISYLDMQEAGGTMTAEILDWAIRQVQVGVIKNFVYRVNGKIGFLTNDGNFAKEVLNDIEYQRTNNLNPNFVKDIVSDIDNEKEK